MTALFRFPFVLLVWGAPMRRTSSYGHAAIVVALLVLAAVCLVAVLPGAVQAQSAPTPAQIEQAVSLFQEGNADYVAGRYDEAVENFEAANALAPNPRLLEYIGRCHTNLGQYGQAIDAYARYAATSETAAAEVAERLAALRLEVDRAAFSRARDYVRSAVSRARGEQPDTSPFRRQELGTQMRDVTVQILSSPRGAEIYVDDIDLGSIGVTPMTTPLFVGRHLIEIRKQYYEPARQIVMVRPLQQGESIPSYSFNLQRQQVAIEVRPNPATASVTFISDDGAPVRMGMGVWEGTVPAGPGTFILQNGGRDRRIERTVLPTEDGTPLVVELHMVDPIMQRGPAVAIGQLIIVTNSPVGEVFVDGESVGRSPGEFRVDVRAGEHTVELRANGYRTWSQSVVVGGGSETRIYTANLERGR